jgi:hypothetical protein
VIEAFDGAGDGSRSDSHNGPYGGHR